MELHGGKEVVETNKRDIEERLLQSGTIPSITKPKKRKEKKQDEKVRSFESGSGLSLLLGTVAFAQTRYYAMPTTISVAAPRTSAPTSSYDNLNDGDDCNNPYIISVRSQEDYDKGHIPAPCGWTPRPCSPPTTWPPCPRTSRSSSTATPARPPARSSALRMLGYDAYNLLYGFGAWNSTPMPAARSLTRPRRATTFRPRPIRPSWS